MSALARSAPPTRKRILIVEDDSSSRIALVKLLGWGYEVIAAPDGLEGFDAALRNPPDLIISDVTMPKLDGFNMVRRLRAKGIKAPVIFVTARDRAQDVIAGIQSGARHYITKPIHIDDLEDKIRKILG